MAAGLVSNDDDGVATVPVVVVEALAGVKVTIAVTSGADKHRRAMVVGHLLRREVSAATVQVASGVVQPVYPSGIPATPFMNGQIPAARGG